MKKLVESLSRMVEFLMSRLKTKKLTSMKWILEQISLRGGSCIHEELRQLLRDLLTVAAPQLKLQQQKKKKTLEEQKRPDHPGAVTSALATWASWPRRDQGRGREGPGDRGSTVPRGQASWPCAIRC